MAVVPIQFPTNTESTSTLRDITSIPIDAGMACLTSSLPIDSVPNTSGLSLAIKRVVWQFRPSHLPSVP